jgi:hypothetical protein
MGNQKNILQKNESMKKYAIGIPTLNRLDLLYPAMLYYEIDFPNTEKFIVDNGNQDLGWNLENISATIIENENNVGVAASWNQLCKAIFKEHDYALILNDDIYLGRQEWAINSFFDWLEMNLGIEDKIGVRNAITADFFVGPKDWCAFIISKKCYEQIGEFDDRFFPAYYEDNDYAMRMKLMGKKLEIVPFLEPAVFRSSETMKKDSEIKGEESKQKYIEKWGGLPGEEMKNAIVMRLKRKVPDITGDIIQVSDNNHQDITVIAFNASCNHHFIEIDKTLEIYQTNPVTKGSTEKSILSSLYNIGLICRTISLVGSVDDAIEKFRNEDYEPFDISKMSEYRDCERLIIVNENEVIIDANA